MPDWPDTVAAILGGQTIVAANLVRFDFASVTQRVWLGAGPLMAVDPMEVGSPLVEWSGLGELISMDGLEQAMGDQAPQATFTLSGVDASLIEKTLAASGEVKGRDVTVFIQFFDQQPVNPEAEFPVYTLTRLDIPIAIYAGIMDVMSVRFTGPGKATISVTAESPLLRRTSPLGSGLMDQAMIWPTDRGLERVPQLPTKRPTWPYIKPSS